MNFSDITARRRFAGVAAGLLLGGIAGATIAAPNAAAAPDCSASGVSDTVSTTLGSARAYLNTHPGANQAVGAAFSQPRDQAAGTLRGYFSANPQEYYDLKGILAPIGAPRRHYSVAVRPRNLPLAYTEYISGYSKPAATRRCAVAAAAGFR